MKFLKILSFIIGLWIAFVILFESGCFGKDWKHTTPLGIRVQASQVVVNQYEATWGPWENIDWEVVDDFFLAYNDFYGKTFKAKGLRVVIGEWNNPCIDCTWGDYPGCVYPRGAAMSTQVGCVQGLFLYPTTIKFHLGKDNGQGESAFCSTPMGFEMARWFLRRMGNPCWTAESGNCMDAWPDDGELGLCR